MVEDTYLGTRLCSDEVLYTSWHRAASLSEVFITCKQLYCGMCTICFSAWLRWLFFFLCQYPSWLIACRVIPPHSPAFTSMDSTGPSFSCINHGTPLNLRSVYALTQTRPHSLCMSNNHPVIICLSRP